MQKDVSPEELVGAIERVAAGKTYVSEAVADGLTAAVVRGAPARPTDGLSAREFEVFRAIAAGKSPKEIAESLHLSIKTVSTYRTRILQKTGFRSNAAIVAYAIRNGLL
jgi:DNA-binding NarL/FixJ family response regulator